MKSLQATVLSALLFLPVFICAQTGIWTQKANIGVGLEREDAIGFSIGNKGYIGTGVYVASSPSRILNDFWEYDSTTDTWSQKANVPGPGRLEASAFVIADKGYVGLGNALPGQTNLTDLYEYDTSANSWTLRAPFPDAVGRNSAASFSAAGKGYICGGSGGGFSPLKELWEYDPIADSWARKADLPGPERVGAVGFGMGDKGYVGTGTGGKFVVYADFYQYDALHNQWTQKAGFPGEGRWFATGFTIADKAYLGSGINADGSNSFSDFWAYDTLENNWARIADMPETRATAVGFSGNGKGYVGTGIEGRLNNNTVSASVADLWEFDPSFNLNVNAPLQTIFCAGTAHTFDVNYTATGNFGAGVIFTVQLLKDSRFSAGGIANPIDVGNTTQAGTGTVSITLPADVPVFGSYRLRLRTSSGLAGPKTSQDISIVNAEISLSEDISNATCNQPAGFIHLNPSLGDGKYQYLWGDGNTSQNRDHLPVGTYPVTVTDVGCGTIMKSYDIIAQSPPSPVISFPKVTAPETVIQLNPIEGVASYSVLSIPNNTTDTTFLAYPQPSPNTTYQLHGLAPQTTYTVQAKSYCAAKADSSDWSANSFQTPCGNADFTIPGNNKWNVYAYSGGYGDFEFSWLPADFAGYYVEDGPSFDTRTKWDQYGSPSDAAGYQGCGIPSDNFSWRALRKGFPCGHYSITISDNTDEALLFVNGIQVWHDYPEIGNSTVAWEGDLDGESIVEFKAAGGFDASYEVISFTLLHDIVPQPTVTMDGPITFCAGGSVTLTSGSASGNQWYQDGNPLSNATGQNYIATTSGTYTVAVSSGGCTSTASSGIVVTVNPVPSAPSIDPPGSTSFCSGGSITLTSGAASGNQWYLNDGAITAATGQTYSATAPGVYTVTATAGGCPSLPSAGTRVTVNQKPNVVVTPSSQTICSGTPSSIGLKSNVTGTTFSWTVVQTGITGAFQGGGNSIVQTLTTTGTTAGKATYTITPINGCTGTPVTAVVTVNPPPTVSLNAGTISCNGGLTTITVNASGTGPFKYKLSGGLSFQILNTFIVGAGTYTVMVQDAKGCTKATNPITISQPPAISISVSTGTINCYGGATTLAITAAGGAPSYTYALDNSSYKNSNSFTTVAGAHSVYVKDSKGCTVGKSIIINQPSTLNVNVSAGAIMCNGGISAVTVSATGGTPPYTNTGTFNKTAGTYTFNISDARGCTGGKMITINQPGLLTVSLNSKTNVSCNGGNNGSLSVKANGGTTPYTYKLNTAPSYQNSSTFAGLTAGNYSVIVKDKNGCTAVVTGISITQPATLVLTLLQKVDVSCLNGSNGSIKVSAGGGTSSYKYSLNNGSYGTSATFSSLHAGAYTVNVKDDNCTKSIAVTINNGTGRCNNSLSVKDIIITGAEINEETWLKAVVSPNPSEREFTLTLSGNNAEPVEVRVVDMYGRSVHYAKGSANQSYKFGQHFAGGVYVVEILQGGNAKTLKIIKGN